MTIHCFFHSADLDGHCSGAIVKYKFPKCELHGITYGYKFPFNIISKDDIVYMVDFSLQPVKEMIDLYNIVGKNLIWIDHHITAIENVYKENPELEFSGIRKNGTAACILTWNYLFPDKELPKTVELLGRYDVWDISEEILQFQYGFRTNPDTWPNKQDELWKQCFETNTSIYPILHIGKIILNYEQKQNEIYCRSCAFEITFEGLKALAVNKRLTSSQLFDSIWDNKKYDMMITFGIKKNGFWDVSFYSDKKDIDVSKIADKYGGGGHKGAAGCQFKELPKEFLDRFKELQESYK